jgi:hypothetical protein
VAAKRVYITIPKRDYDLILRTSALGQECPGQWCRRQVLTALYRQLEVDSDLQDYDAQLAAEERAQVITHGR